MTGEHRRIELIDAGGVRIQYSPDGLTRDVNIK
jgi:hypothetical protein